MTATNKFFFPLLLLQPDARWAPIDSAPFHLTLRQWGTSTFDLATLETKHKLHLPYQLMDVMLAHCNMELRIDAVSKEDAVDRLHAMLLGLYLCGTSPTIAPFATSYSINEYSGINSRDSEILRDKLPKGMQDGITSNTSTVEVWPIQLSLQCIQLADSLVVTPEKFLDAAGKARKWLELEKKNGGLRAVRDAAQAAPLIGSTDQSLLHVWCALEALFPKVSTEVSFRIALYLAQLQSVASRRDAFKRVRDAYNLRSRVAHGSSRGVSISEWRQAWNILMESANAILLRGALPNDEHLLDEILTQADSCKDPNVTAPR